MPPKSENSVNTEDIKNELNETVTPGTPEVEASADKNPADTNGVLDQLNNLTGDANKSEQKTDVFDKIGDEIDQAAGAKTKKEQKKLSDSTEKLRQKAAKVKDTAIKNHRFSRDSAIKKAISEQTIVNAILTPKDATTDILLKKIKKESGVEYKYTISNKAPSAPKVFGLSYPTTLMTQLNEAGKLSRTESVNASVEVAVNVGLQQEWVSKQEFIDHLQASDGWAAIAPELFTPIIKTKKGPNGVRTISGNTSALTRDEVLPSYQYSGNKAGFYLSRTFNPQNKESSLNFGDTIRTSDQMTARGDLKSNISTKTYLKYAGQSNPIGMELVDNKIRKNYIAMQAPELVTVAEAFAPTAQFADPTVDQAALKAAITFAYFGRFRTTNSDGNDKLKAVNEEDRNTVFNINASSDSYPVSPLVGPENKAKAEAWVNKQEVNHAILKNTSTGEPIKLTLNGTGDLQLKIQKRVCGAKKSGSDQATFTPGVTTAKADFESNAKSTAVWQPLVEKSTVGGYDLSKIDKNLLKICGISSVTALTEIYAKHASGHTGGSGSSSSFTIKVNGSEAAALNEDIFLDGLSSAVSLG